MKKILHLIRGKDAAFYQKCIIASLLFISTTAYNQGNGSMACNEEVQVSLDGDCEAEINPDMILEGTYPDLSLFSVSISGVVGNVVVHPGFHTVTITNTQTNNSCWGYMSVEDKLPPVILNCPCPEGNTDPDCQFLCSDLQGLIDGDIVAPKPVVDENCTTVSTFKSEKVIDNGCSGKVLEISYKYSDEYGNMSQTCKTYYYLAPISLDDVVPPTKKLDLPCGLNTSMQSIYDYYLPLVGHAQALVNAYPTINGAIIDNQGPCNLIATKTDSKTLACGADCPKSFKMVRTWEVIDWCSNESDNLVQIISTKDTEKPTIVADSIGKTVNPWNCAADITFPNPRILHDNCDDNVSYTVLGPVGVSITYDQATKTYKAINVPKGLHDFYYKATDCCGNMAADTIKVNVVDRSSPVAISKEYVVVSLTRENGHDGIAKIYPQSIDNGSHDGCSEVHLEIRREGNKCGHDGNLTYNNDGHPQDDPDDPDGGNFVKFCCEDLTDVSPDGVPFGQVKVWLRVWDDGDMDGKYGTAGDNYNETWSWVRVEDKLPPSIQCPPDITLECWEDYENLDKTGRATAKYTCSSSNVEYEDTPDLSSCGFGVVLRKWFLPNNRSNSCTQKITIREQSFFDPNSIVWPPNETVTCKDIHNYEVTWTDAKCALLGVSVKTDTFQFVEDVCLKIINTYTVVDWCIYEPNNPQTGGIYKHTQIVKVLDKNAPTITCRDTMVVASDPGDIDKDGVFCEAKGVKLSNMADDSGDCSSKWLRWQIFVDLWGDGVAEYEYTSFVSSTDVTFNDTNGNGIPDIYVKPTNSGEKVMITIPEDIAGSMSNHKITWKVTDGCGNHKSCTTNLMVVDKKKPTPYCISLSSAVMNDGTVELWARDFDQGSFDNCTAKENLLFTFDNESPVANKLNQEHFFKGNGQNATEAEYLEGNAQKWVPLFKSSSRIFDCDDLPVAQVKMTVWDEKGEFDFCVVTLSLVDNQDACDNLGSRVDFSGLIVDEKSNGMSDVTVSLNHPNLAGFPLTTTTDGMGLYVFENQPATPEYSISVSKDGDYMNGVSTLDLVLMQRHILEIKKLDNPFKAIAADINNDGKVRTSDLVALRKVILGVETKFENNSSWRFIDRNQNFTDPNNPWPFNEVMDMNGIMTGKDNINFVGQKIGDLNGDAKSNLRSEELENRSYQPYKLVVENNSHDYGSIVEIPVYSTKEISTFGLQATFRGTGIDFISISSSVFTVEEGMFVVDSNGDLKVSIAEQNATDITADAPILYIKAKVRQQGQLIDLMDIVDADFDSEIYDTQFESKPIQLTFRTLKQENEVGFNMIQNEPNPFSESTHVTFSLPQAGTTTFTLYDIDGKVVNERIEQFTNGQHTIEYNKDLFPLNGVYYLKLEHNNNSSVIKMIYLK